MMRKKRFFTSRRIQRVSSIFSDIAQVFFASVAIPGFLDSRNLSMIGFGLLSSGFLWGMSIILDERRI